MVSRVQVRLVAATAAELHVATEAVAAVLEVEHVSGPRPRRDGSVAVYLSTRLHEHDQDHDEQGEP